MEEGVLGFQANEYISRGGRGESCGRSGIHFTPPIDGGAKRQRRKGIHCQIMFEELFKNIRQKIEIGEKEEALCRSLFIPKKFRKRQYLLQQGDVSKYTIFVEKGLLRSYLIDDKGSELIMQFAPEGWWIGDMYSIFTGEISEYNIDAIEDTETLLLSNAAYEQLMQQAPVFERYFRLLVQNSFIALQRRFKGNIILNAEEKYKNFMVLYPNIVQRVPQHHIASFLGITPESLSRIRRQMTER